jgi:phage baseplate assembly protein W
MSGIHDILGTGIAFPVGVDETGRLALVRDEIDIDQAIELILGTAPGERPMRPEFGCAVHEYVFDAVDAQTTTRIGAAVRGALERWEPRIVVLNIDFDMDDEQHPGALYIDVRYRIKATNDVRNLVYPFYVIPEEE